MSEKTFVRTALVVGSPEHVHRTFVRAIWRDGGFPYALQWATKPKILIEASNEAGTGCKRRVPFSIEEEITTAELGKRIVYHIPRKSVLSVIKHLAEVTFEEAGATPMVTKVVWTITYTPKPYLNWMALSFFYWIGLFLHQLQIESKRDWLAKGKEVPNT